MLCFIFFPIRCGHFFISIVLTCTQSLLIKQREFSIFGVLCAEAYFFSSPPLNAFLLSVQSVLQIVLSLVLLCVSFSLSAFNIYRSLIMLHVPYYYSL